MTKELGGVKFDYTHEYIKKRHEFTCSIAESSKGPTIRTWDKWLTMYRFLAD